jgi:hypothetical protein
MFGRWLDPIFWQPMLFTSLHGSQCYLCPYLVTNVWFLSCSSNLHHTWYLFIDVREGYPCPVASHFSHIVLICFCFFHPYTIWRSLVYRATEAQQTYKKLNYLQVAKYNESAWFPGLSKLVSAVTYTCLPMRSSSIFKQCWMSDVTSAYATEQPISYWLHKHWPTSICLLI